jgi:hypothetical protein
MGGGLPVREMGAWSARTLDSIAPLSQNLYIFYSLMKLYERCIRFVKNVTTTTSDEQMTKIKVVLLQKL